MEKVLLDNKNYLKNFYYLINIKINYLNNIKINYFIY